jgi:hypothetical protein
MGCSKDEMFAALGKPSQTGQHATPSDSVYDESAPGMPPGYARYDIPSRGLRILLYADIVAEIELGSVAK